MPSTQLNTFDRSLYPGGVFGYARQSTSTQIGILSQVPTLDRFCDPLSNLTEIRARDRCDDSILTEKLMNDEIPPGSIICATEMTRFGVGDTFIDLIRLAIRKDVTLFVLEGTPAILTSTDLVDKLVMVLNADRGQEALDAQRFRTINGIREAQSRGVQFGRPKALSEIKMRALQDLMGLDGEYWTHARIAELLDVSKSTVKRGVKSLEDF